MTFQPDQEIAHFRIIRKLGEGGMGEVYLAEDQKLTRKVAIKILHPEFFDNRDRMERFQREAKTAARVTHANVMAIYDIGMLKDEASGQDFSYIVMEYVDGISLTDYLKDKMPSMTDLLRLAGKVASGLSAAHRLDIVHRDIKTDNIIINEQGEPKILDFGLAKPVVSVLGGNRESNTTQTVSQELTQEGKIVGTVTYMSPEQARGEAVDSRSDIFSFGVMLYRMFSGEFPFGGADKVSTIAKILEAHHTPLRHKNESLPAELERIVDKCLQKNPNDRYQDTRDLVVDLRTLRRQYESGITDTSSVMTSGVSDRTGKKTGILGGWKWELIAGLAVIAVVTVITMLTGDESGVPAQLQAHENALAILGFENKTGDAELDWLTAGLPEILLTDLAQSGTANVISRSRVLDCLEGKPGDLSVLPNHQECLEAAQSLGAAHVLSGSFYKLGDKIRIDARLEDITTGRILLGEKVIGDDPFALVDSLTQKIAQSLNLQSIMGENVDVATYTSSSPEAYKQYILGMELFGQSRHDEAIAHFEQALAIDSTFALAHMRIGMANTFEGRQQEGLRYYAAAKRFEDRLPLKERNLLDIYHDTWFKKKYDDAFVKLKTFVANYPDDKEARTIYAIYLSDLGQDSEAALGQLDTVLMIDSKYQMALEHYARIYGALEEYDKAIEYTRRIQQYYPESPSSYARLARLYQRLERYEEAINEAKQLIEIEPGDKTALSLLVRIYIMKRDFDTAEKYAEKIREHHSDNPYDMVDYYDILGNLASWKGRFRESQKYLGLSLEETKKTGDSALLFGAYTSVATYWKELGNKDSALFYSEKAYQWATTFQGFSHAFMLIEIDRANEPLAREIFDSSMKEFKVRVPQEMWPLVDDGLAKIFDGYCKNDTALSMEGYVRLFDSPGNIGAGDRLAYGELLTIKGQPQQALDVLNPLVSGPVATNNGGIYLKGVYRIGKAYEAMGDTEKAVERYTEVLKYWDKPDIELKLISDARARLAKLTA